MNIKKVIIIGAGGHGKVIYEALLFNKMVEVVGFMDASLHPGTIVIDDCKVLLSQKDIAKVKEVADFFIVAIGNNIIRTNLFNDLLRFISPISVIHPSAVISREVQIDPGTVVLAGAIINRGSQIGQNSIINTGSIIDHDCIIGKNVHLAIGTFIGSNAELMDNTMTSIGENIPSFAKHQ